MRKAENERERKKNYIEKGTLKCVRERNEVFSYEDGKERKTHRDQLHTKDKR